MFDEKIEKIIGKTTEPFGGLKAKALTKEELAKLNADKIEQIKKKSDTEKIVDNIL